MMDAIGQYILSVTATALLCGIICSIMKDTCVQELVKLVCGLAMLLSLLQPAANLSPLDINFYPSSILSDRAYAVDEGQRAANNAMGEIIKEETQAYILDKAASLGLILTVDVILSSTDPPVPESVEIRGKVSPYEKLTLEEMIQADLNIPKENQLWIG